MAVPRDNSGETAFAALLGEFDHCTNTVGMIRLPAARAKRELEENNISQSTRRSDGAVRVSNKPGSLSYHDVEVLFHAVVATTEEAHSCSDHQQALNGTEGVAGTHD